MQRAQRLLGVVLAVAGQQPARRLGHQGPEPQQDGGRDQLQADGDAPRGVRRDRLGAQIDERGDELAHDDHHLDHRRREPAQPRRHALGLVHGHHDDAEARHRKVDDAPDCELRRRRRTRLQCNTDDGDAGQPGQAGPAAPALTDRPADQGADELAEEGRRRHHRRQVAGEKVETLFGIQLAELFRKSCSTKEWLATLVFQYHFQMTRVPVHFVQLSFSTVRRIR